MLFIGITAITLFRVGPANFDSTYFEDGNIFLPRALENRFGFLQPYAGYVHFVPSALASLVVSLAPLVEYAYGLVIGCAILIAGMSLAVFWLSRDLIPAVFARLGLILIPAILPLTGDWVNGVIAHFHVYFPWFLIWVLLARYRSYWSAALFGLAAFAAVASAPETFFLFPIVIWVLIKRDRKSWPMLVGLTLGAAAQCYGIITEPFAPRFAISISLPSIFRGWLQNGILPLIVGDANTQRSILIGSGLLVPLLILSLFITLIIWVALKGNLEQGLLGVGLLISSFAPYCLSAIANSAEAIDYANHPIGEGSFNLRYGVTPGLFLVSILPLFAAVLYLKRKQLARFRTRRIISGITVAAMLCSLIVASTGIPNPRLSGPIFSQAISDATTKCKKLSFEMRIRVNLGHPENESYLQCSWLTGATNLNPAQPPTCSTKKAAPRSANTRQRIAGSNRYETAVQISQLLYTRACRLYLVSDPVNAIMVAPLAKASSSAVLLTEPKTLPDTVRAEISRLQPTEIVVADRAITFDVYFEAKSLAAPGATITNTSTKRADSTELNLFTHFIQRNPAAFKTNRSPNVYLANTNKLSDAVVLANVAAAEGAPFLLIDNQIKFAKYTIDMLKSLKPINKFILAGGPDNISSFMETELKKIAPTERITGQNHYQAAAAITATGWPAAVVGSVDAGYAISAESIPETATVAQLGVPLFISKATCMPKETIQSLASFTRLSHLTFLGKTTQINDSSNRNNPCPN